MSNWGDRTKSSSAEELEKVKELAKEKISTFYELTFKSNNSEQIEACIDEMISDPLGRIRGVAANYYALPLAMQHKLAVDAGFKVREILARNIFLDSSTYEILSDDEVEEVVVCLAQNRRATQEVLWKLGLNPKVQVRKAIASNPSTPINMLFVLSKDESVEVRKSLASSKSFDVTIELLSDKDLQVIQTVLDKLENPELHLSWRIFGPDFRLELLIVALEQLNSRVTSNYRYMNQIQERVTSVLAKIQEFRNSKDFHKIDFGLALNYETDKSVQQFMIELGFKNYNEWAERSKQILQLPDDNLYVANFDLSDPCFLRFIEISLDDDQQHWAEFQSFVFAESRERALDILDKLLAYDKVKDYVVARNFKLNSDRYYFEKQSPF